MSEVVQMRAVHFDRHGGAEVLEVRDVERPVPGPGEVLVRVKAAAINPGEIAIREGRLEELWPTTFPSGEGSDLAGLVVAVGDGAGWAVGDGVLGWTDARASHADFVVVPAGQLVAKPEAVPWEVAGSLFVAPLAAFAVVDAAAPRPGETIVVSGAAGGVGSVAVQLARLRGATVIGLAGPDNHAWLRSRDIVPVAYGDGQLERIQEAAGGPVHAFADTFGSGYADLAIALGVPPERISTIIDYEAVERLGIRGTGTSQVAGPERVAEIAELVADGRIEIPIARTYPLEQIRDAYEELGRRHTHGKIVLIP